MVILKINTLINRKKAIGELYNTEKFFFFKNFYSYFIIYKKKKNMILTVFERSCWACAHSNCEPMSS